jgi:putative spermidine/putrescine transport system ATP-binding protein
MVEARVRDVAKGMLELDGQEIYTGAAITKGSVDQKVMLAIRPEMINLDRPVEGNNTLNGRIENLTFLGSVVRTQVRLAPSLFSSTPSTIRISPCQRSESRSKLIFPLRPA